MAEGPLRSLLVDGVIAGAGSVHRLPAADPDPVPLHPAARGFGLPAARRLPARQPDGQGRSLGPRLHPAPLELRLRDSRHHGDAHDRELEGPARDDHGRAADDLLGAAAGLRAADRRLRAATERRPVQPARPHPLRPLRRRRRLGDGRRLGLQAGLDQAPLPAADARAAALSRAGPAQPRPRPLGARGASSCAASAASSSR